MLKKVIIGWCLCASLAVASTVTVQPGDSLSAIATRYNTTVAAIQRLNHLSGQSIRAGQELQLPDDAFISVQPGDTLESIAKRNGVSVEALRRANGLTNDKIRAGQRLRLTGTTGATPSLATSSKPVAAAKTYTVKAGDTLEGIAKRVGVSVEDLRKFNQLVDDRIRPDQVLQLSASQASKPKPAVSATSKPATKVTPAPQAKTANVVTVQAGDTLSSIAKRNNLSLETLRHLNNLTTDNLRIGQQLRVSAPKPPVTAAKKPSSSQAATKKPTTSAQKPPSKASPSSQTSTPVSAQKPLNPKPTQTVSKPSAARGPTATTNPQPIVLNQPVAKKPATPSPATTPIAMDTAAAAPMPTAPSDMLDEGADFPIVEPDLPLNINRNERLLWPVSGILTSRFGYRWGRLHTGLDIAIPTGTAVYAALSGTVQFSGWNRFGYGYLVVIHGVDNRLYYYGHNSRLLVKRGQFVHQGTVISRSGSTGNSTGPHLHFEVRIAGRPRNPLAYLPSSQVLQARYAGR